MMDRWPVVWTNENLLGSPIIYIPVYKTVKEPNYI